jgi:hypothetical protein
MSLKDGLPKRHAADGMTVDRKNWERLIVEERKAFVENNRGFGFKAEGPRGGRLLRRYSRSQVSIDRTEAGMGANRYSASLRSSLSHGGHAAVVLPLLCCKPVISGSMISQR